MGSKLSLRLTDDDPLILLETENLKLQVTAAGDVKIEGRGKLQITAPGGIDLKSDGSINIEAGGAMKLAGATIDLN